jgi:DNA-binding SARP family transcriptional activator
VRTSATGGPDPEPPAIEFLLLGPFEVRVLGEPVPIGSARQRVVLATLLLAADRVVPVERLTTAVWDDEPPATARAQVQICISRLRARLAELGVPDMIDTHESGYLARPAVDAIDLTRFRRLVAAGRDAVRRHELAEGAAALRTAVNLWRGEAASGVPSRLVRQVALRLDEQRLAVTEECLDIELCLGRHPDVIGELRELLAANPLREKLYAQLMLALYRDGRQAEALSVYQDARRVLVEERGLDPGAQLRTLERAILDHDPALALPAGRPAGPPQRMIARLLPAPPKWLVGRASTIAAIVRALTPERGAGAVVVVSGPAGVGKSALVLHTAYAVCDRFPDGQLYAHLRGSDASPVPPEQVLDQFLRALGLAPSVLPGSLAELAARYRNALAGSRTLVVLDDAAGAWQVEPLVPGGSGGAVLVTARGMLPGLPDAHRFDLTALSPPVSWSLLSQVLGPARVAAEPDATASIAESCGHLPLALHVAAAKLSVRQHWRIEQMASRLRDESRRLDELSLDGGGVRASLSVAVGALPDQPRRLLLLLGTLGATDFAGWVAGPLLDVDASTGADLLEELVDARLVEVQVGAAQVRYRLHDLVRIYAQEALAAEVPADARAGAQHRLLRCWLTLAAQAHRREYGGDFTILHSGAVRWPLPAEEVDRLLADPVEWYESERLNLVAAVRLAAELEHHDICWDLAVTSVTLFEIRGHREDWRETHEVALRAARRSGGRRAESVVRCSRAGLALVEQRLADAQADLTSALAWFEAHGEVHGRGLALRGLGVVDRLQGRDRAAEARLVRALADLRSVRDRVGEAHVLTSLAQIHTDRGHHQAAQRTLAEALQICCGVGARRVEAQARYRLGDLYLSRGELGKAWAELTTVLGLVTEMDDPVGRAYALLGIGTVHLAGGELEPARAALADALVTAKQTGSRLEGQVLAALAELSLRSGDAAAAARQLAEADAVFEEIGAAAWRARVARLRERLAGG